jgi:hypothetical protein
MSFKFVTEREIAFINKINKELLQHVIGQEVSYYEISVEDSAVNTTYEESSHKVWRPPVKCNALVLWDNPQTRSSVLGPDSIYSLEVYFHTQELNERNLVPKDGDFVEFGEVFFEITSVTHPQLVFGQVNNKIMTKCMCVPAREGQFQAGGDSEKGEQNTHPVENTRHIKDPY